jgi:class 3 adenylate cyclase/HAMP domain-containing protein
MDAGFVATTKLGQLIERYWKGESRALYDGEDLTPHVVPWELERAADGTIWFIDLASHAILRRSSDGSIRPVLSRDSLGRAGFPSDNAIFYRLSLGNDGMLVTYTEDSVAVFGGDGRIATVRQGFSYSKQALLIRWAGWAGVVIEICCLVIFAVRFYRDVLNKRISIILKQIIVLVPLLSISIFAVSHMIIRNSTKRLTEEQANRIALMAQNLALMADPSDFKGLNSQRDYMSDKYQGIRARFQRALNGNRDPWNRGFYYAVYRVMNDQIYGLMYYNDRIGMFHPFGWFSSRDSIYRRAAEGEVATEQVSDESGDWLYAVAPVRRPQGGVACLIEVGTDLYIFREANSRLIARTLKLVGGVTLGIILIVVFTTWLVLKALRLLQRGVAQISARNWDVRVRIRSRDEVYDLANTFNDMAQSIHSHLGHIEELNVAYKRFVPQEFLLYLNKPSVIDANLGDQVQKEMTVLFSDIRSFTNLSEKMTPKENFDFLNNYLSAIGPFIRTRNGFIDKYIGDAIMALFARSAEDAVDAAIDMRNALLDFNRNRTALGQEPIEIGIGIHCGTLMLGILGEAERREGTVISDNVNLASRLEHITKQYGAPTILSQAVYERLPNPDRFNFRRLGSVRVKGKTSAMTVYELLDGQPPADRIRKIVAKEPLEAAIRMYERGDFLSARKILDALLETNPDEKVGILYNQACTMHIETGMPQDWDGSITLHIK